MTQVIVTIDGLDAAIKRLEKLGKLDFLGATLLSAAEHIKGVVATYPPATIANSPNNPRGQWYERGYGPRWHDADGIIGGRKTSEMLGRRWTARKVNNYHAVVGNNASYAPFVQGPRQKPWHKRNGWITIQQVAVSERKFVVEAITKAIMDELRKPA